MADVGNVMSGVASLANAVIQPFSAMSQQQRNQKYTKKNMIMQYVLNQRAARENAALEQQYYDKRYQQQRDDQYAREDYLLANQKAIEVKALRDAGMNPALANGVGAAYNTSAVSPSASSVGANVASPANVSYSSPFSNVDLGSAAQAAMKTAAEIKLMKAQADNLDSQTTGNEQKNFFTDQTMWDNIRMTKAEMNQKEAVANYMNDNPELNMAVAKKQATLNENIEMDTSLKEAQITETSAREFLEKAQAHLSEVQALALNDDNLRKNHDNVWWLLNRVREVQSSGISADEKADLLVLYGACLDNCSKVASDYRHGKIEDFLNYHKATYDTSLSADSEYEDPFSDFVGDILQALSIGCGMRVFGGSKKSFDVQKKPQNKTSKQKAKSFEDGIVSDHKKHKTKRKD